MACHTLEQLLIFVAVAERGHITQERASNDPVGSERCDRELDARYATKLFVR